MAMRVGDEFDCYANFREKVEQIERNAKCVFVVSESKTVQSSNKAITDPEKRYKDAFKYRFVKLVCKHYGSLRTKGNTSSKSKSRPNQA